MARTKKKPRLGRGLSSLISNPVTVTPPDDGEAATPRTDTPGPSPEPQTGTGPSPPAPTRREADATTQPASANADPPPGTEDGLVYIGVEHIRPNPHQPRQSFDETSLSQLAASIRRDGLMQPIIVRPSGRRTSDGYELVAGERRWRAARQAGLDRIPALVRALDDQQLAEWALVENLQREDLNPVERAEAFRGLIDRFALSHAEVALRVGVERSTVTNYIRLLDLPAAVIEQLRRGRLSAGHARAIIGLDGADAQVALADRVVAGGWSVRMVEAAVRRANGEGAAAKHAGGRPTRANHLGDLEEQIAAQLKTKVHLKAGRKKGSGTLAIEFYSLDEFDALLGKLGVKLE